MRVWTIANQKGGVGKTTLVAGLAGLLAEQGRRVLLLDLDPHGSLTSYLGHDPDSVASSSLAMFELPSPLTAAAVKALVHTTYSERVDLVPATTALATIERRMQGQEGLGLRIARALGQLWEEYDYVLIDTPPVLGVLMVNALAACERLVVPVQTEHLAIRGLDRMLHTLAMINRSRQKELPCTVVPTMYDRRTQASVTSLRTLRNDYDEHLWPGVIPVDTRFRDASRAGCLPSDYAGDSRGMQAMASLLKYLLQQHNGWESAGD